MAPAWDRAKHALATRLCIRFPARQRAVEDAPAEDEAPPPPPPPAAAAARAVPEEKLKSPSVSVRRLSSSGSWGKKVRFIFLAGRESILNH